jgi:hypothetical protein
MTVDDFVLGEARALADALAAAGAPRTNIAAGLIATGVTDAIEAGHAADLAAKLRSIADRIEQGGVAVLPIMGSA